MMVATCWTLLVKRGRAPGMTALEAGDMCRSAASMAMDRSVAMGTKQAAASTASCFARPCWLESNATMQESTGRC